MAREEDNVCGCGGKPLAYLGYGCSSEHWKAAALNVRTYFVFVAIVATELLLFFMLPDSEVGYVNEQLAWQGLLFMGLLMIAFAPMPHLMYPGSFILGTEVPVVDKINGSGTGTSTKSDGGDAEAGGDYEYYYSGDYEEEQEYVYEYIESSYEEYYYSDDDGTTTAGTVDDGAGVKSDKKNETVLSKPGYVLTTLSLVMGTATGFLVVASGLNGSRFGMMGAAALSGVFVGFLVVAAVVYRLRTKYGYTSIFQAVHDRYGAIACVFYALIVAYYLHGVVWRNISAGAVMYGLPANYGSTTKEVVTLATQSAKRNTDYWIGLGLVTGIPLVAAFCGGRRWSMLVSAASAFVLVVVLAIFNSDVLDTSVGSVSDFVNTSWNTPDGQTMGLDLLLVSLIHGLFAYPWANPIVMDHAFVTSPGKMVAAFVSAFVGVLVVVAASSTVSLHGFVSVTTGQDTATVVSMLVPSGSLAVQYANYTFGHLTAAMVGYGQLIVAMTSLAAAFVSAGQFVALDLAGVFGEKHRPISPLSAEGLHPSRIVMSRVGMLVFAAAGVGVHVYSDEWWSDVSGAALTLTMASGLGVPIVAMELVSGVRPLAFIIPVVISAAVGILHAADSEAIFDNQIFFGDGAFKYDLGIVVLAAGSSIAFFALGWLYKIKDSTNRGDKAAAKSAAAADDLSDDGDDGAEYEYYDDDDDAEYEYYDEEEYEYYE